MLLFCDVHSIINSMTPVEDIILGALQLCLRGTCPSKTLRNDYDFWRVMITLSLSHVLHAWWRHQMETFSALLAICAGNSPVPGEFPAQRPVTRNFDVSFDLRLNNRLSKQSWGWWFEMLSRPLWRHCYVDSVWPIPYAHGLLCFICSFCRCVCNIRVPYGLMWQWVKSLWPSDDIFWHKPGSTLAQVMAYCLTAPSHYLKQCWLIIRKIF